MPWNISKRDGKYCVVKKGASSPVPGGCHASRADAIKHQRALFANEPSMSASTVVNVEDLTDQLLETKVQLQELTAAVAPLKSPMDWFRMPEATEPTPLTFTKDGQVFGHLALWNTCHTGFLNGGFSECVKAPHSQTDYSFFHLGKMETADGSEVTVGKLTYDTSHAPISVGLQAASRHYDQTGSVGAFVRATDGQHGIWISGVVRSDLSPEGLRDLRANPPSGDWRALNGNLELIASLAVVVPGFPIPRSQLALSASANGDLEVAALILPGYCGCDELVASYSTGQKRKRKMLMNRVMTAAALTTEKRNALSKSSFAIPSRRAYPIFDRAHAANALARSSGKPEEAQVRRAVCRKFPDMCKS